MSIAAPTASPPTIRAATKVAKVVASDASSADTTNSTAAHNSTFLRPSRSLSTPANALPTRAPQPRLLTAQPSLRSPPALLSAKYSRMNGTTPEITVASKPSNRPPIAAVRATNPTLSLRGPGESRGSSLVIVLFLHRLASVLRACYKANCKRLHFSAQEPKSLPTGGQSRERSRTETFDDCAGHLADSRDLGRGSCVRAGDNRRGCRHGHPRQSHIL